MGIRGVTVSDVKGFGAQGGSTERQGGKYVADLNRPKFSALFTLGEVFAIVIHF